MDNRIYELECDSCGHIIMDTYIWKYCFSNECRGLYAIIDDYPAGI